MKRGKQSERAPAHVEELIDEMSKESFPASDSPQLPGLASDGAPSRAAPTPHPAEHAPPPDAGIPAGTDAAAFDLAGRYRLDDSTDIALATEGPRVRITLARNPLTLDAAGLEALIALLERHRPSLHARNR